MCEYGNCITLELPDWYVKYRNNREVSIDSCIADDIKYIWSLGIETLGCCCGHGKPELTGKSVIVGVDLAKDDCDMLGHMLFVRTGDSWNILQWQQFEGESRLININQI